MTRPSASTTVSDSTFLRVGAGSARRRHAAERCVCARIYRKEQTGVAQVFVELLAGDPRFNGRVEILCIDPQDPVHLREIDAHAASERGDMALERGSGAKCDRSEERRVG